MKCPAVCGCLFGLALAGCSLIPSDGPTKGQVIAQAERGHDVLFDVVKIDDRVIRTLDARPLANFRTRFKQYGKPPPVEIAVGDTLRVVIWESAAGGLFGNSLSDLSAAGTVAKPSLTANAAALNGLLAGLPTPETASQSEQSEMLGAQLGGAAPASTPTTEAGSGVSAQTGSAALNLSLLQAAAQGEAGQPGTVIPKQLVGSDGAITVPYAGRIPVVGQTPAEVAATIEARLAGKALDPQALVLDLSSPANSVSVTGAVIKGSRVALEPGGERLLQVIAAAGGAEAPVRDAFVALSRGGVDAMIPLSALVANPEEDIYARPGDDLTIVRIPKTFTVFGATGKNTAITFDADRLSLTEAVAKAGGLLDERADPRGVFLLRYEPDRIVEALGQKLATGEHDGFSPVIYRLDLHDPRAYLLAREFNVHDKDIIYVSNAKVVSLYKFFTLVSTLTGPVESGFLDCYYTHC